jgi:DNA-binding NtrC family response regulator
MTRQDEHGRDGCSALTILVISSLEDFLLLDRMLGCPSCKLLGVRTCRDACHILLHSFVPVVISDRNLPDGCWKHVLCAAESSEYPAHLVVASQLVDGRLWAEVLNLGGYDVLAKPFEATEVTRVVESAVRNWKWVKGVEASQQAN